MQIQTFHDEFLQEDFSVDAFLQNHSATYTLEGLRDSLRIHLKSIESRMIDIVNSESDTILSLSSSMNGLDERINNFRSSLEQLMEEVMSVLHILDYYLKNLNNLLNGIKAVKNEKHQYINLVQAMKCCDKVKRILESDKYLKPLQSDILLRAVDQYILMETHLSQSDQSLLVNIELVDIATVKHLIYKNFDDSFMNAFQKKDEPELISCLQVGVLLCNQKDVENLLRKKVISPKMDSIINEKFLSTKGLDKMYETIFKFIDVELKSLLLLTSVENRKHNITGYNIFINSIWLDIEEKLRLNLSSIFAPGNPTIFQNRFVVTVNFINKLNSILNDKEHDILNHNSYKLHMKRWNLPVYYQICFNDIVLAFETILVEDNIQKMYTNKNNFKLEATVAVLNAIQRCLASDVYITQIVDKFLTLIFQILSRYNTWIDDQLKQLIIVGNVEEDLDKFKDKIKLLIFLHYDIKLLSNRVIDLDISIMKNIEDQVRNQLVRIAKKLEQKQNEVENSLATYVSAYSMSALKHVSNIPRLYRKTNRNVPTEPAQYVYQVLAPSQEFINMYQQMLPSASFMKIIDDVYTKITTEYVNVVNEILTQVQKTEDSLRRLKKVRQSQSSADVSSVGDDQKIRIQLQLDVNHYSNQIQQLTKNVELTALNNLVKITH